MPRTAARVDANQKLIVEALRKCGATVQSLAMVGKGVPDLLVGYRGKNYLMEIKDGAKPPSRQRLTQDEIDWHANWRGDVKTITSAEAAIEVVTAEMRKAKTKTTNKRKPKNE